MVPTFVDDNQSVVGDVSDPWYSNDLGLWPKMNEDSISYWLRKGSSECRHSDGDFEKSGVQCKDRVRHCTKSLFTRTNGRNGETIDLSWICFSKTTGKVYRFLCKPVSQGQSSFTEGFNDWGNSRSSIESHSRSSQHVKSLADCTLRRLTDTRIDKGLVAQYEEQCSYWRKVVMRSVDVLKFICERGLALRGRDDKIGSVHNGNFLGVMELLGKYDTFLADHLHKYGNKGNGHISYLSHYL